MNSTSSLGNNPSLNPADNGTLAGTLGFVFKKLSQSVEKMLPAQVIAYDRTTNRVQVQLLITLVTTNGSLVSRSQLASIPVLVLGGGGFMINFPLVAGNLGWVCANDRDISLFLQTYQESPPNTVRMFSFSDGVFIPDIMTGYTIQAEDSGNMVIQNAAGTVRVALWPAQVKITAPTIVLQGAVDIVGGVTITGDVTGDLTLNGNLQVNGEINETGNMLVTGNIGATGTITPGV